MLIADANQGQGIKITTYARNKIRTLLEDSDNFDPKLACLVSSVPDIIK
jgi:hypothetical protein